MLWASPAYIAKFGMPQSPQELSNHHLLQYNLSNSTSWNIKDKKGNEHQVKFTAKIIANNGDFLKEMAIAGHGIVATPTFISWQAIAKGDLVRVLSDYQLPQPNAYAVYPQSRYLSQRTRLFIDFLVNRFGDTPYWDKEFIF